MDFMHTINSEIQLLSIVRKSNVVIYGAGAVSKALVVYMLNHEIAYCKLNIVVSKVLEGCKIENIPVFAISDISIQWNDAVVIIAAMENQKYEMKDNAENYCGNVYILDDDFCMHLRHLAGDSAYDWAWIQKKYGITSLATKQDVVDLHDAIIRLTPQPALRYLVLNILDHCNLNCKGCDHFASIAEKREISYKIVESDLRRFSEIMNQDVKVIGIMGGEPLLHTELPRIIHVVRKYFPNSRIQVDTNGLLLLSQDETFWRSCWENDAVIVNTKYPINLNHELIEDVCEKHHVAFEYYGDSGEVQKRLYKIPLDIHGTQEPRNSFAHCFHANNCVTLMEGKLYPCTIAPNVHIFNQKYGTHMELCKDDYIDIYDKVITKQRVLEFVSRPIPFCRFCNIQQRRFGYEWERSRQEITEWVATEREKFPYEEQRIREPRTLLKYEVHLTEHCNLNCKGCFHFSCIAKEEYLSTSEYEKDCGRLSLLYGGKAGQILLLGGEPLLHPQIIEFFKITRTNFPIGEIVLVTNGLLLLQTGEEFWNACRQYDISIEPTKYPITLDYGKIEKTAVRHGVKLRYFNNGKVEKTLTFQPLDLSGSQPKEDNFYGCYRANQCITLKHGYLYTCIMPAHVHHFCDFFSIDLPDFKSDGINIYTAESADEINTFLTRPIEMCRYCNRRETEEGLNWEITKKQKNEWVKE